MGFALDRAPAGRTGGYIFRRTVEGIHIIHLGKAWEKLMVAARMTPGRKSEF